MPSVSAGQVIEQLELSNASGDTLQVLNLGATIREWNVRTQGQAPVNIVLGYPCISDYEQDSAYLGAMVGRYCNRIANSRFSLDGREYLLAANEGLHQLHGGPDGFHRRLWRVDEHAARHLTLGLHSRDGDQGYPGNLDIRLRYQLEDDGSLILDWEAQCDRDTVVSLTNHAYFNLAGSGDVLDHLLRIPAANYTPVGPDQIPNGELVPVAGSVLDLRRPTALGDVITCDDPEIVRCSGLDHNWALGEQLEAQLAAELICPRSGLSLQVHSTLPGIQCYTANALQESDSHRQYGGVCLETQYYPNSPNEPRFPSPVLRAGRRMQHRVRYEIHRSPPGDRRPPPPRNTLLI